MIRVVVYDADIKIDNLMNGIFFDFVDFDDAKYFMNKCLEENHPIIVQNFED